MRDSMKLELKHIVVYLPYSVSTVTGVLTCSIIDRRIKNKTLQLIRMHLRPLSDLTKEIEYNGEKFIPLFELFKLIHEYHLVDFRIENESEISYQVDNGWNHVMSLNNIGLDFGYDQLEQRFHLMYDFNCYDFNYIEMHEKLLEWHFDVFGLIDNDLAIDINKARKHRQRWQCGGRIIQYCGKQKSNRTFNKLKKIKATDPACFSYTNTTQF